MFDEMGRQLRDDSDARIGKLVGYRLCKGEYQRVEANDAGRLPSEMLELELCVSDALVRFYDPATAATCRPLAKRRPRRRRARRPRGRAGADRSAGGRTAGQTLSSPRNSTC